MVARAVGWSLALHGLALALLALAWPWLRQARDEAEVTTAAWLRAATTQPAADARARPEPPTTIELLRAPADEQLDVAHPGAPTPAPNLDARAGAAAPSSGAGAGAPTVVTERADALTLKVQPFDAANAYALQRIATARLRLSRESVRATPHPAPSPWLASARGVGHAPARLRQLARPSDAPRRDEADRAPPRQERRADAGFSRPQLAAAPAATDGAQESDDVADRVDRALVSDARQPAPLELTRPTSPGATTSGQGMTPNALGYAPRATGAAPVPAGAPRLPDAPALAAATYQRAYELYLSRVKQKVDPLWEFPRELAIRMEQGDVLVGFTIRKDGSVRDVRVLKASGFPSFDKNVLAAVKKAAPFPPLPATFGAELKVTAPFEGSNPAIR